MPQHFSSLKRLSFIGLRESLWNVRRKGLTVVVDWRKGSIQKNASIPRMTRPGSAIIEPFLSTTDKQANRKGGRALFVRCRTRYNQKPSCALTKKTRTRKRSYSVGRFYQIQTCFAVLSKDSIDRKLVRNVSCLHRCGLVWGMSFCL